ncbi:unnamed protein product [Symbiodinium microadriaticum]|nr:unnamed protein product [Symbiodinium microadriaticum]
MQRAMKHRPDIKDIYQVLLDSEKVAFRQAWASTKDFEFTTSRRCTSNTYRRRKEDIVVFKTELQLQQLLGGSDKPQAVAQTANYVNMCLRPEFEGVVLAGVSAVSTEVADRGLQNFSGADVQYNMVHGRPQAPDFQKRSRSSSPESGEVLALCDGTTSPKRAPGTFNLTGIDVEKIEDGWRFSDDESKKRAMQLAEGYLAKTPNWDQYNNMKVGRYPALEFHRVTEPAKDLYEQDLKATPLRAPLTRFPLKGALKGIPLKRALYEGALRRNPYRDPSKGSFTVPFRGSLQVLYSTGSCKGLYKGCYTIRVFRGGLCVGCRARLGSHVVSGLTYCQ